MTARQYATPLAFKQALEQRLKSSSATGVDFGRRRQLLVFDRFLARLAQVAGDAVTLKGGLVLELRLARARTTKDIDLRMMGSSDDELELQEAGRLDLGDHMLFEVQPDADHPEIQNEGMRYDGFRYRTECRLAGMIYSRPFGVDVAFGDPLVGEPDIVTGDDILGFAGIAPPSLRLYPVVSHIAEKLHAFTMPRPRPNTRVRDLPDLALLATTGPIDGVVLRRAIEKTFEYRGTHAVSGRGSAAARLLGSLLRGHGCERRVGLGDFGGSDARRSSLPESRLDARRTRLVGLGLLDLEQRASVKPTFRAAHERGSSATLEAAREVTVHELSIFLARSILHE